MRAKDLQIGDWVYNTFNRQPEQVVEIWQTQVILAYNDGYGYDEIVPIPLTPEILEKNTSESNKNVFGGMNYALNADYFIETRGDRFCFSRRMAGHKYSTFWVCDIHYVHDLQHLIKLVGIDKEIQI